MVVGDGCLAVKWWCRETLLQRREVVQAVAV